MSLATYHGSCHCSAIRYQAGIDPAAGTVKCNCSICTKMRFWAALVAPSAFRLLQGGDALRAYRFHTRRDAHHFCSHCGIHVFTTGATPRSGPFVAIHIASLDDMPVEHMLAAPVRYIDGRHDNWLTPPAETRHL